MFGRATIRLGIGPHSSYNNNLQFVGARFLIFLLGKLSCEFKLRGMSTLQDFQKAIFPYCLRLESHRRLGL